MSELSHALKYLAAADDQLRVLIAKHEITSIIAHTNYYDELVSSIISQQLSVKAAATIQNRFLALYDGAFPTPAQIISTEPETLRSVGLSRQKIGYIHDLAEKVASEAVSFDHFDTLTNDEIVSELTTIKGVGVWTAHMFLIFCMGRLGVLPTGDLGIRTGIQRLYSLDHLPTVDEVTLMARSNHWHPYESIASRFIWKSLDNEPNNS